MGPPAAAEPAAAETTAAAKTAPAVAVVGVGKDYGGRPVLDGVSMEVAGNAVHGFLGPNGAGKSTTMAVVAGLVREARGRVLIHGEETPPARRCLHVGLLPESPPLYPHLRVLEHLRFARALFSVLARPDPRHLDHAVERCGLAPVLGRFVGTLSGGWRQRTAIAAALAHGPRVVMLDEPLSGLDPAAVVDVRRLVRELAEDRAVLLSSHRLAEVEELCDRVTIIDGGRVVEDGPIAEVGARARGRRGFVARVRRWDGARSRALLASPLVGGLKAREGRGDWSLELLAEAGDGGAGDGGAGDGGAGAADPAGGILAEVAGMDAGLFEFRERRAGLEEAFRGAVGGGRG